MAEPTMSKETTRMIGDLAIGTRSHRRGFGALLVVGLLVLALGASPAAAAVGWDIKTTWGPTDLPAGGEGLISLTPRNIGDAPSEGQIKVVDHLPPGVTATEFQTAGLVTDWLCFGTTTVTCKTSKAMAPPAGNVGSKIEIKVAISPTASGTHANTAIMSGSDAEQVVDVDPITFASTPGQFGVIPSSFAGDVFDGPYPSITPERQAGTHPYEFRVDFDLNELYETSTSPSNLGEPYTKPIGRLRTVDVTLPRGLIGNPEAAPKCSRPDFLGFGQESFQASGCPSSTQVGTMRVLLSNGFTTWGQGAEWQKVAIYNLEPPPGYPADFGYKIAGFAVGHIFASLDPAQDYAIKATSPFITDVLAVRGVQVKMWGVPGDPRHDAVRANPVAFKSGTTEVDPSVPDWGAPFAAEVEPFFSLPMDCGVDNGAFQVSVDSWNNQGAFTPKVDSPTDVNVTGCNDPRVRFKPALSLQPTSRAADSPTGLNVDLEVPLRDQAGTEPDLLYPQSGNLHSIDTPPMKKVVVTFPKGMTISTSAAQGLGVCSSAQIGIGNNDPVTCPDSSQYGELTLSTPLLPADEPMKGFIYIAKKGDNPFNNFLSMYFVIEDPSRGLRIKIPGKIDLDPVTGQIVTTFDDLPQFPVSNMRLSFKGGVRSALVNPATCGSKTISATFYSWAAPTTALSSNSSYAVTQKADGSPCVNNLSERPFKPEMSAGTVNPNGGSYSPFIFRMTRSDDDQELSQIGVNLPAGLTAKIAGISRCSDAAIAAAANPLRTGTQEATSPSCPASSQIGTTDVGSGVGVPLTYIPGKVYLAGRYKGSPLSMVVVTPILAGPYDLGVIVVRSALGIDPVTTEVHALTDPFPQIFEGIPVRIRDIRLKLDRSETMLNPTNCGPASIDAHLTGAGGDVNSTADDTAAEISNRFQVGNCASLPFKPALRFNLKGGTKRGDHPALKATLTAPPGANMRKVSVALPRAEFLDQSHIGTVCTRVQFAADACPQGSVYGFARAWTPLLDEPVDGPVYLRSSNHQLPDLVMALHGLIDIEVAGRIDSINGGIRSSFETIPDQPVSKFVLMMKGGGKGLLQNSTDICKAARKVTVLIDGQNGKTADQRPVMKASCGSAKDGRKARSARRAGR
jgi:hypothetical protein